MSEQTAPTTTASSTTEGTTEATGDEQSTFTQADIDRIVSDRLARERSKYSDYDDLKAKADRLEELEDAERTELEKATGKVEKAERRAADAETRLLQLDVAMDAAPEGMTIAQIRKLAPRLQGTTREELEADAEELFSDVTPSTTETTTSVVTQPKERLKPAATGSTTALNGDPLLRDLKNKLGIR